MEKIHFYKYQGTGNDFVLIDNRDQRFGNDQELIHSLCHRRFGIGADGLMFLEKSDHSSFTMRYYNSDGLESTMCGNGGRCIAFFAVHLGIVGPNQIFSFEAIDGLHEAEVMQGPNVSDELPFPSSASPDGVVNLRMGDVEGVEVLEDGFFLNTGSPHYVRFVDDPGSINVYEEGRFWRNHKRFAPNGTNVNFVGPVKKDRVMMRTFERGVEDETWSCGTGAVASAIASALKSRRGDRFEMKVPGGSLTVSFQRENDSHFRNVWLKGPVRFVFEGDFYFGG